MGGTAGNGARAAEEKGLGDNVNEIWTLVRDYAKQETVDPLKSIGRFVAYGVAGSLLLALGLLFGSLALLRGLQAETGPHLTGSWNWVPYAATLAVSGIAVGLAVRAISKPLRDERVR